MESQMEHLRRLSDIGWICSPMCFTSVLLKGFFHVDGLLKPGKPPEELSSYRPIYLLDTMGKILERIIYNRLCRTCNMDLGREVLLWTR